MTVLSDVDIINHLGGNIFLYPIKIENIKGNILNMTASKLAWSLHTKESVVYENVIQIQPFETVLIETEETISISNKLSGTFHSKVKLVSKGLSHINTVLEPTYLGPILLTFTNFNRELVKINVGDIIIAVILNTMISESEKHTANQSGRLEVLIDYSLTDYEKKWLTEGWRNKLNLLKNRMIKSKEYLSIKESIQNNDQ